MTTEDKDSNIVVLGAFRAEKDNNAKSWTPADALKAVLQAAESDDMAWSDVEEIIIIGRTKGADNLLTTRAGTSYASTITMLTMAQFIALQEWNGEKP